MKGKIPTLGEYKLHLGNEHRWDMMDELFRENGDLADVRKNFVGQIEGLLQSESKDHQKIIREDIFILCENIIFDCLRQGDIESANSYLVKLGEYKDGSISDTADDVISLFTSIIQACNGEPSVVSLGNVEFDNIGKERPWLFNATINFLLSELSQEKNNK